MDIETARKKFLSHGVITHVINSIEDALGSGLDNNEVKYVHKCMRAAANEPIFFSKPTLKDCCETVCNVAQKYITRARYIDSREDMTQRVMSESGKYIPMHPLDEKLPTLFELLGKDDSRASSEPPQISQNSGSQFGGASGALSNAGANSAAPSEGNVGVSNILGISTMRELSTAFGFRPYHILLTLDTRNRILIDNAATPALRNTITWNYFTGTQIVQGSATSNNIISNIIGIECAALYFPTFCPNNSMNSIK